MWKKTTKDVYKRQDEFNVGAAFQSAAAVSIAYSLMSRCGLEADDRFEHEDFLSICLLYTSGENSFGYLATWAKDRELTELRASLETVRSAVHRKLREEGDDNPGTEAANTLTETAERCLLYTSFPCGR